MPRDGTPETQMLDGGQSRVVYYDFTSIYIAPRGFVGRTEYERILSEQDNLADEKESHVEALRDFLDLFLESPAM